MARVTVTIPDNELEYYKEHAEEKRRSLSNLVCHALEVYCTMNKLRRERTSKRS